MALLLDDSITLIVGYLTLGLLFVYIPLGCLTLVAYLTYDQEYEDTRPEDDEESFLEMLTIRLEDAASISKMTQLFLVKMVLFPLCLGVVLRLSAMGLFETGENTNSFTFFISTIVDSPVITGLALQWVIGIAFMLLVTVLLLELREVLHPDVFDGIIRVPDDQHLLLTLIQDTYFHHVVRICKSTMVYGTIIAIIFYSPTLVLRQYFRSSLFNDIFPIPFPTYYIWTTGQVAAEVGLAHVIVLNSVDPLKGFL
jgi:E3 ubiquitin-protein ligase MARCH6